MASTVRGTSEDTPNKGQDSEHHKSFSYAFLTSEERTPLYNGQNNLSQHVRYSEVPLYLQARTIALQATGVQSGAITTEAVEASISVSTLVPTASIAYRTLVNI